MHLLKPLPFGISGVVILLLAVISILEKTGLCPPSYYTSWWMTALWGLLAISSTILIVKNRLYRRATVFSIHASMLMILVGAMATWCYGVSGTLHIEKGASTDKFQLNSGETAELPFTVRLSEFYIITYPGTSAPMDFESHIEITDKGVSHQATVAMNHIHNYNGYRFYQSSYNADCSEVTLSVYYDPVGIAITYTGYFLLFVSFIFFFFTPNTLFRNTVRRIIQTPTAIAIVLTLFSAQYSAEGSELNTENLTPIPAELASQIGEIPIYYNNRVAPMATFAKNFVTNLNGKPYYKKLSAEQVTAGFIFHFSKWKDEPIIMVKNRELRGILGITSDRASYNSFFNAVVSGRLDINEVAAGNKHQLAADIARFESINTLVSGSSLKLFPVTDTINNKTQWYSPVDNLPLDIDNNKWIFIRKSLGLLNEKILSHRYDEAARLIEKIKKYQQNECGVMLPPAWKCSIEIAYNRLNNPKQTGIVCLILGLAAFIYFCMTITIHKRYVIAGTLTTVLLWLWITFLITLRWIISGHIPLANGFETMQFMAWCSITSCLLTIRKWTLILPLSLTVSGFALLVASMSGNDAEAITPLLPVLSSPLLSIHVAVIMIAYSLLTFMMLNGIMALATIRRIKTQNRPEHLADISRAMLYPAVFLLATGIFIGAIWANISWGNYWSWDPKETWALITMLIYSFAIHSSSLPTFKNPRYFHIFNIAAFVSVIITYFGVNFLFGGLHSYA